MPESFANVAREVEPKYTGYPLPLHGLATLRLFIILAIGVGYASTMSIGPEYYETGNHWGYGPSWFGVQLLFIFSGFLAARTMAQGKTVTAFFKSRIRSLWPALIAATLFTVCFIYPVLCTPDAPMRMSAADLATYFFKTVFLIDPGAPMPGVIDDAKYMCLLQGAIWTLRIGLFLHIAFLLGWLVRIFQNRNIVLAISIFTIIFYVILVDTAVKNPEFGGKISPLFPLFRLAYAYIAGVAIFMWQDKLQLSRLRVMCSAISIALLTTTFYKWLPWSSIQEIMGVTVWLTICLGFLHQAPQVLRRCPRISPVLYVSIWPAAQVIVALLPDITKISMILMSIALASLSAAVIFLLLRQARIQPARL